MSKAAVFLDKDGTLVPDIPYNSDPALITFANGAPEALRAMAAAGYELVVVSNQSGVARGYFDASALEPMRRRLDELAAEAGARFAGCHFCPHHPEGSVAAYRVSCDCRKPGPGMLLQAAGELRLDLGSSWMVGDILDDMEAGRAAGVRTILIDNGNETEWEITPERAPHFIVADLRAAAETVLVHAVALAEVAR